MKTYRCEIIEKQWGDVEMSMVVYIKAANEDGIQAALTERCKAWTLVHAEEYKRAG